MLLTPEQAADTLAVGSTTLYRLLATGALASVRIGGSRRIPYTSLRSYVDQLQGHITPALHAHRQGHRPADATRRRPGQSAPGHRDTIEALRLPLAAGDGEPPT